MVNDAMDKPAQGDDAPERGERLQKYLAQAGVASRRHAEQLIAAGAVTVNGQIVTTPGKRVAPDTDTVCVNGQPVRVVAQKTTVAIYKPTGYVATAHDPQGRPIIGDLLPSDLHGLRLVPVGRLDADSEGLILLSNDGDLALKLTHPRYETEKEYHALVQGHIADEALQRLRRGVVLAGEDERPTAPAVIWRVQKGYPAPPPVDQAWLGVIIHEGRKRQIRLMFAAVGARVERLVRVRIGQLQLADVAPAPGTCHRLTAAQNALTLQ
jgi:pseudouridine synthase